MTPFEIVGGPGHTSEKVTQEKAKSHLEARTKVLAMSTSPETVVQKEPANLKEARLKKARNDRQKLRVPARSPGLAKTGRRRSSG